MLTLYGIPNCATVKKARAWLAERGVTYGFHDYKKVGVDPAALDRWVEALGWEALLNRTGTTFRKLPEAERIGIGREEAVAIMLAHPSAVRRPVLEGDGVLVAGFKPDRYEAAFAP